jgi:hypothetical protein
MNGIELLSDSLSLVGFVALLAAILVRHPRVMKWRWAAKPDVTPVHWASSGLTLARSKPKL